TVKTRMMHTTVPPSRGLARQQLSHPPLQTPAIFVSFAAPVPPPSEKISSENSKCGALLLGTSHSQVRVRAPLGRQMDKGARRWIRRVCGVLRMKAGKAPELDGLD